MSSPQMMTMLGFPASCAFASEGAAGGAAAGGGGDFVFFGCCAKAGEAIAPMNTPKASHPVKRGFNSMRCLPKRRAASNWRPANLNCLLQ